LCNFFHPVPDIVLRILLILWFLGLWHREVWYMGTTLLENVLPLSSV